MDVLVTGANGFIGAHMVAYLKQTTDYYVRAADIEFTPLRTKLTSQADEILKVDLRRYPEALNAVTGVQRIYHFAADMGGVGFFSKHDYYPYLHNQLININMLKAAEEAQVESFFFSASACVYPTHLQSGKEENELDETMIFPAQSDQMYGWEKLMTLMLCERAPFDARVGIFNTIYGPYQDFIGERVKFPPAIVKKVIDSKKTGKPIEIWGDGEQRRQYCYITDALEKIQKIMTHEYYGPVNVTGDELVSCTQVAHALCGIAGIEPNIVYDPTGPSGVITRKVSGEKFRTRYGLENKVDYIEGFTYLYTWMKEQE